MPAGAFILVSENFTGFFPGLIVSNYLYLFSFYRIRFQHTLFSVS